MISRRIVLQAPPRKRSWLGRMLRKTVAIGSLQVPVWLFVLVAGAAAWAAITFLSGQIAVTAEVPAVEEYVQVSLVSCGCDPGHPGEVTCSGDESSLTMAVTEFEDESLCQATYTFLVDAAAPSAQDIVLTSSPSSPGADFPTDPALPATINPGDSLNVNFRIVGNADTIDYAGQALPITGEFAWEFGTP